MTLALLACALWVLAPAGFGGAGLRTGLALLAGPVVVGLVLAVGPGVAVAGSLVAGTVAHLVRGRLRDRAARAAAQELAAYLGAVTADLRAGATLAAALATGARRVPDPRLRTAAVLAARGASAASALEDAGQTRLAGLVQLGETHGVPLADLLEREQHRVDTGLRDAAATAARMQGPQATATVLAALPVAGIVMGEAMGARPIAFLTGGGLGGMLLVVGTALACCGFAWARYIIGRAAC